MNTVDRIGIIADIHANVEALNTILAHAKKKGVRKYILLGDYIDYGANPNEVLEIIDELDIVLAVLGNHDEAILTGDCSRFRTAHGKQSFEWTRTQLSELSLRRLKKIGKYPTISKVYDISICHGNPLDTLWGNLFSSTKDNELDYLLATIATKWLLVGHSHLQFEKQFRDIKIVNPGSVGQPRNGCAKAQYAILEVATQKIAYYQLPYDYEKAAKKIFNNNINPFLAQRLYLGI